MENRSVNDRRRADRTSENPGEQWQRNNSGPLKEIKPVKKLFTYLFVCMALLMASGFHSASYADQKHIAIMWVGRASMPNDVTVGFLRKAKELAPDLEVTLKRELPDMQAAEKLFRQFEETMNGVIFLRSTGTQFLAKADPKIPCFVGATDNPVELGALKDMNSPDGNITGVTYDIPHAKRFEIIKMLFPSTKTVALVTEKGHPGGIIDQKATREECDRQGLAFRGVEGATVAELVQGIQNLAGKVDLIILGNNKLVLDNATNFARISQESKTPLFAYSQRPVQNGALAALVARNDVLGGLLAESVVDVVVRGKPVSKVPVKTDPNPEIVANEAVMNALGITFSPVVMSKARIIK
jgi:putative ABC transport system substrate-binding protein